MNHFYLLVALIVVINVAYIIGGSFFLARLIKHRDRDIINFMDMQIETNKDLQRQIAYLNLMTGVTKYKTGTAKYETGTIDL